ncbi:MAG: sulfotransferase domain-containing protein [Bacteroidia bacterium]|nr:sulfotransferase domain-containing protein [Bacteroidia bacterium]
MKDKVDFFIVGAPKAGTTSLHNSLALHDEIFMPEIKEPNFFSSAELRSDNLYYNEIIISSLSDYEKLFAGAGEKIKGDASVSYLFYPSTASKIFNYNPEARIIILLRQPIERAVSHYQMDKRLGFVNAPMEAIFADEGNNAPSYFQQYFQLGKYAKQVKRYMDLFPESQMKFFLFEEVKNDFRKVMKDTLLFLGIKNLDSIPVSENQNASFDFNLPLLSNLYRHARIRKRLKKAIPERFATSLMKTFSRKSKSDISDKLRIQLKEFYRDDILALSQLINKNLNHWL